MKDEELNNIKKILQKIGYENYSTLTADSNIINSGITSLFYIQLIVELELYYDIEINTEYLFVNEKDTLQKLIDEIIQKSQNSTN